MKPNKMREVIDGKIYDTEKANIIASDAYWDGHNWERHGRNQYLYKTKNGNYFAVHLTCWQGERVNLVPLTQGEAIACYEELPEKEMEFEQAFPGVKIKDA